MLRLSPGKKPRAPRSRRQHRPRVVLVGAAGDPRLNRRDYLSNHQKRNFMTSLIHGIGPRTYGPHGSLKSWSAMSTARRNQGKATISLPPTIQRGSIGYARSLPQRPTAYARSARSILLGFPTLLSGSSAYPDAKSSNLRTVERIYSRTNLAPYTLTPTR